MVLAALGNLHADALLNTECFFGGGTRIVLALGEYRESADVDFLCASRTGYRALRASVSAQSLGMIARRGVKLAREVIADRYGIRTFLDVNGDHSVAPGIDGRVINIGTGDEACLRDVAARIVELTGGGDVLHLGALPDLPGDLARLVCDPSLAASLLQWRARTSLDSGLSRTIAHARAVRASARPEASTPAER